MPTQTHYVKPQVNQSSLDSLEDHIIQHPQKESFYDSPAFLVLLFVCIAVVGSLLGALLAL